MIGEPSLIWKTPSCIINVVNPSEATNDNPNPIIAINGIINDLNININNTNANNMTIPINIGIALFNFSVISILTALVPVKIILVSSLFCNESE